MRRFDLKGLHQSQNTYVKNKHQDAHAYTLSHVEAPYVQRTGASKVFSELAECGVGVCTALQVLATSSAHHSLESTAHYGITNQCELNRSSQSSSQDRSTHVH